MGLYERVVNEANPYFGGKADEFVKRQLKGHLGIEPRQLKVEHLEDLAWWCQVSGSLVLDKEKAQAFGAKIKALKAEEQQSTSNIR